VNQVLKGKQWKERVGTQKNSAQTDKKSRTKGSQIGFTKECLAPHRVKTEEKPVPVRQVINLT